VGRRLRDALDLADDCARRPHERRPRQSASGFLARLEASYGGRIVREETGIHEERPGGRFGEDRIEVGDVCWSVTARGDEQREQPWRRAPHSREVGRGSSQPLANAYHGRHVGS
jgi:hypothetical protein